MRAWTSPEVPDLSELGLGRGSAVEVFDTSTGALTVADPPDRARLYVCGITPYDATHLGHAATYLTFDLLQRAWRDRGLEVLYTQNITDVDDPLLERATATGVEWSELANREIQLFREDMAALRILAPDHYIGAVESIDLAVALVERLRDRGVTYEVDGDVYFAVHEDADFGSVSGYDRATMLSLFAERGGDPDRPGKRDPLDCLLWQAERPGEPSWDSPFGRGRPGWHVECASIALETLGEDFDVQGGGTDLIFPHHEMSASEAHAATQHRFARAYVHQAMVAYDGEKMSKSLGNLVLVSRLRADGRDPVAIRLALLAHHYRTGWAWADGDIVDAHKRLARWREAFAAGGPAAAPVVAGLRQALARDLDTPQALAVVDAWVDSALAGRESDDHDPASGRVVGAAVDALLGVV
ncbi:cysteine--1-D-myo-inosityl 2-amino-2-deoxy-alpha-D-glucopyranoside ligase [Mumia sp. zg.B17]|uniref:cysteine--1-D-myo-inosityl 2-amino-2-deoxy-alpha-D-glucopyranoside ligase n=1 Tax=unclassified Mumia TaxID=2621872 RepID=UPI001C6DFA70|nr:MULTISPECIES: cysteine--1-D-myo-inosityl 2-amino-2-deoxy-alpha-D-glucopyranoside ligase [unclassified Mumia]MBW9205103.1 cysteine--1-D-myo-inosityl 2-amino-2-deoxy-alpha-D-glucopyranoside ligase [Mumia sp. zg.B17]MDD9348921.1 cysteine--1-D-myo-inosityl 2-amino-2-deoxy-alpha-D-glucopyranoside ligase [Mumia sp.]